MRETVGQTLSQFQEGLYKSDADNVKLNILKKIVAEMNLDSATDSSSDSDA